MNGAGTLGPVLLVATLATPLVLLLACLSRRLRDSMPALLVLAPLPGLAAALLAIGGTPLAFDQPQLKISLALDVPGAILLGVAALLWSAAGVYAFTDLRGKANSARFAACWLLTLTGSLGVFIAADLLGFYLVFALVSLPAYGLIAHDDDDDAAQRAGGVYMAFTVLGEAFLLLGFVLLAAGEPNDSLQIRDVVAALPQSPWRDAALGFTVAGFALKIGTVPAHGWMPLSLYGRAHSGRIGAERCRRQGGRDRAHPLPAPRRRDARRGRNAGRARVFLRLLWRGDRHHTGQSQDGAGLFQHQPDGRDRRRARHGPRRRRQKRGARYRFLCRDSRVGEGRLVPGRRRRRRDLRAPPAANAAPGGACWRSVSADCP